ncbi:MAG: GNAT family N-acetyltransferase [Candidatus Nanoarchaeia archaeon]
MKIRQAEEQDIEQIKKFVSECLKEIYGTANRLEDLDNLDNYLIFYIAIDGRIVGTIGLTNQGRLRRLYVDKEYRRQGIGKQLLDKLIKIAKENNINRIVLSTYNKNKEAINFYKKHGFHIDRKIKSRIYMNRKL